MVRNAIKGKEKHFECEECGFKYKDKAWAEKCEKWCKEKHSCNIEIIAHAVND